MDERETEHNALTPYAATYPAQVKAAGRQLGIAAQLKQDLESRRLVAILKRIAPEKAITFLSSMALDGDLIERFADFWSWDDLSVNTALPWSIELIKRFEDRWDWGSGVKCLAMNTALPWSADLIGHFVDRCNDDHWTWTELSQNTGLAWSAELIKRFEDRWNWRRLSDNTALPWSLDLIERYKDRWDWGFSFVLPGGSCQGLSKSTALPWSLDLIERYKDRWDWSSLSYNTSLPWSLELIERYKDRWEYGFSYSPALSGNTALPWSLKLIEGYEDKWDWETLAKNKGMFLPLLRPADIIEIMKHHSTAGGSRTTLLL